MLANLSLMHFTGLPFRHEILPDRLNVFYEVYKLLGSKDIFSKKDPQINDLWVFFVLWRISDSILNYNSLPKKAHTACKHIFRCLKSA